MEHVCSVLPPPALAMVRDSVAVSLQAFTANLSKTQKPNLCCLGIQIFFKVGFTSTMRLPIFKGP